MFVVQGHAASGYDRDCIIPSGDMTTHRNVCSLHCRRRRLEICC